MAAMALSERRMSSPMAVLPIWEAMISIRNQKQASTLQRISAHVKKTHNMSEEAVEEQLILMVIDSLVIKTEKGKNIKSSKAKSTNKKLLRTPSTSDSFQLPAKDFVKGQHDWYCFECHGSGKVLCCTSCHRVYHPSCVQGHSPKEADFVCPVCKMLKSSTKQKITVKDLKASLTSVFHGLKDMSPSHRYKISKKADDSWQLKYLLYDFMDLVMMEDKVVTGRYRLLEEFEADILLVIHNVNIIYGVESEKGIAAKELLTVCQAGLEDIRICPACYRISTEKGTKLAFCEPCDPPHELVYAKQIGFSYWPAKVMSKTDSSYDVRFFGGPHERAVVSKALVKPITTNFCSLVTKRSSTLKKACEELAHHQKLLGQSPVEVGPIDDESDAQAEPESPPIKQRKLSISQNDSVEEPIEAAEETDDDDDDDLEAPQDTPVLSCSAQLEDDSRGLSSADCHNVVSSTQDSIIEGFVSTGTQTLRMTDTDTDVSEKSSKIQLLSEIKMAKDKAIRANTLKLEKKHYEDKGKAVALVHKELEKRQEEHQRELEKCLEDYQRELKGIHANYQKQLAEAKKKQWCYNCEREAVYHCCWNTSYCSVECQQVHWQKEHKRNCRRKRNMSQHNQTN